jgi:peroxiredoxin
MKAVPRAILLAVPLFTLAPAVDADQKGDALLKQLVATTRATQSISADLMVRERSGAHTWIWRGEVALKRPNLAQVHLEHKPLPRLRGSVVRLISDGKRIYWWETPTHKDVRTWPTDPRGGNIDPLYGAFPVLFFYGQFDNLFGPNAPITSRYVGQKKVDEKRFEVVDVTDRRETSRTIRFYIGPDNLLHRTVGTVKRDEEEHTYEGILTRIQTGERLPAAYFRFRLPEGMTLYREPTQQETEDALLPMGTPAPQFTLAQLTGGTLALSDALKNRKALLINFWYYGCGACREEFPHLQKLYGELKDQGFSVISINRGDSVATINKYVREGGFTFPIVISRKSATNSVLDQYHVQAYPTNYLVDVNGEVVYRSVGFDEKGLRAALKQLVLK